MFSKNHINDTAPQDGSVASRPWRLALLWLLFLGPFFFISYGFSNSLASQNPNVSYIVFAWEQYIPFIPWTILPYWVIDILYALSLFICTTPKELNSHAKRLLTAQVVAVICFVLFPLGFSFERPETSGITGWLFATLSSFDQPYNQAPSLHITLLVIIWVLYIRHLPSKLIWPFHILCVLIGISVLTTYQHHFIDVPTGALLGWLCVWLWPLDQQGILATGKLTKEFRRWRIAAYYFTAAAVLTTIALWLGGVALWLLWPAISLLLVAMNYIYFGSKGFQKNLNGEMSVAAKWLYIPYLLAAQINSRLWTKKVPKSVSVYDGVDLGRFPSRRDLNSSDYHAVVDLTAEFGKPDANVNWHAIPNLDLVVPNKKTLVKAARLIAQLQKEGNVLVTCALGYSRSALAVIAWLLVTGRSNSVDDAIKLVKQQRPSIVISDDARAILADFMQEFR